MHLRTEAIICAVRAHGESGAIVRALTPQNGLLAGYVRGGHSRRLRPVLMPSNIVAAEYRARTEEQLASLSVELIHSRAPLMGEPLAAAALDWTTALTAASLPEGQPFPELHDALDGVLGAIEAAPAARGWAVALVRFELLLLSELGFGLDLERCAVTDSADDLVWVSPKTGRAVSAEAGAPYADRLLRFPAFLRLGGAADWPDIIDGLKLTGHFLTRDILAERRIDIGAARERLVERLKRAVA